MLLKINFHVHIKFYDENDSKTENAIEQKGIAHDQKRIKIHGIKIKMP